jgi:hypothetical protein
MPELNTVSFDLLTVTLDGLSCMNKKDTFVNRSELLRLIFSEGVPSELLFPFLASAVPAWLRTFIKGTRKSDQKALIQTDIRFYLLTSRRRNKPLLLPRHSIHKQSYNFIGLLSLLQNDFNFLSLSSSFPVQNNINP